MAKSKEQKEATVKLLVEKIGRAKSLVFTRYAGVTVKVATELRRKCRLELVEYLVAKKTLMGRAFHEAKLPVDPLTFTGEVATLFGYADEVAPARILVQFAKDHPTLKPFGGILDHTYVDAARIAELSALPSKAELLAKAVGSIQAPLSGLMNVLSGNLRGLVQALRAISQKA